MTAYTSQTSQQRARDNFILRWQPAARGSVGRSFPSTPPSAPGFSALAPADRLHRVHSRPSDLTNQPLKLVPLNAIPEATAAFPSPSPPVQVFHSGSTARSSIPHRRVFCAVRQGGPLHPVDSSKVHDPPLNTRARTCTSSSCCANLQGSWIQALSISPFRSPPKSCGLPNTTPVRGKCGGGCTLALTARLSL